jgi:glycine/sarcosine N-methyltransferase
MYDSFSADYDRFVNWLSRLGYELPFIEQQLQAIAAGEANQSLRILDTACGTGQHAIALALRGFRIAGADLSAGMIAQARANAAARGMDIPFTAAGFGSLARVYQDSALYPYNALLCLGNSLPHLTTAQELAAALADFAACLLPGGLLILQNRNFDAVMAQRDRWMEPQSYRENQAEWLFLRFYDYETDGLISFNILTLHREGSSAWRQRVTTTRLRPLLQIELTTALTRAGFEQITCYGDMRGSAFDPLNSGNLIITARTTN